MAALGLVGASGAAAFGWPLLAAPASGLAHSHDAPWLFAALLPLLLAVAVAAVADTGLGPKAVAMLGVLAAAGAALRPLGAGTAGLEPMFFLMVLAGRVLGPGFGFVLGALSMFAGALLTGGVGPWMPFQMLSMGWVSMGAGLLPWPVRLRGRAESALLALYGAVAALFYGLAMNLQGWPYIAGLGSGISFVPGGSLEGNLARYAAYVTATSLGWDIPRAALTVVLTLALGGPVLRALRRATRRAAFAAPVTFTAAAARAPDSGETDAGEEDAGETDAVQRDGVEAEYGRDGDPYSTTAGADRVRGADSCTGGGTEEGAGTEEDAGTDER